MNNGSVLVVGSSIVDLTFYTANTPTPGQTVLGSFQQGLGGKGFNQAVAAKLSGTGTVTFVSSVGNDTFAQPFVNALEDLSIEHVLLGSDEAPTGAAAILVDSSGQNSIVVDLGASGKLLPEVISGLANLSSHNVILFQFETSSELLDFSLKHIMQLPNRDQITVIVNPAPATFWRSEWLDMIDILTPNETELKTLFGIDSLTAPKIPLDFKNGRCHIINTLGERGVAWYNPQTDVIINFDAQDVGKVVDTSGAGDAFNGGLVTGLINNDGDINEAIKFANVVGGLSVTKKGTSSSFPTEEEINDFLNGE